MDYPPEHADLHLTNNKGFSALSHHHNPPRRPILRCCSFAALVFSLFPVFFFSLSFVVDYTFAPPISLPSQCKIVSTSVDLKSSKVCELGLLNYRAKHVFYPFEIPKFRCRYDYYWASIFKVEYEEHSSGERRHALAQAPKEALPINCRPSFGTAWLTKEKFRVNGTYYCRYTPGFPQVDIYSDSHFNCHAKDPSAAEMMRRYFILFTKILNSLFYGKGSAKHAVLNTLAGICTGMSSALVFISVVKLLSLPKFVLPRNREARKVHFAVHGACIKRTCFLVAYLSIVGYFTIQYIKMLGLAKSVIIS